jgi:hypothetical protein
MGDTEHRGLRGRAKWKEEWFDKRKKYNWED